MPVLPSARAQRHRRGHRRVARRLAAHELDERHQRHRVHEVQAEHAIGARGRGGEPRDRDRRRVGREQRRGRRQAIERDEQRALGLDRFDDRLDGEIDRGQRVERIGQRQARQRGVAIGGGELALLDELGEALLDALARAIEGRRGRVVEQHVEAGLREHLGDAEAHGAGADDADAADIARRGGRRGRRGVGLRRLAHRSTASATPLPPPRHSAATPRFTCRRRIA